MPPLNFTLPALPSIVLPTCGCAQDSPTANRDQTDAVSSARSPRELSPPQLAAMGEPYSADEAGDVCPVEISTDKDRGCAPEERNGGLSRAETAETQQSDEGTDDGSGDGSAAEVKSEQNQKHEGSTSALIRPENPDMFSNHHRWAVSAPHIDLTGDWTLLVTPRFKSQYARYLSTLGFGYVVRSVALSLVGRTSERTRQSEGGRRLTLVGSNPRGVWERTLVASGYPDFDTDNAQRNGGASRNEDGRHMSMTVSTADGEPVCATAWWERSGTVHRSFLRGGKKYGGGDFESLRYLEEGGRVLVCESVFHPHKEGKKRAGVMWKFVRAEAVV